MLVSMNCQTMSYPNIDELPAFVPIFCRVFLIFFLCFFFLLSLVLLLFALTIPFDDLDDDAIVIKILFFGYIEWLLTHSIIRNYAGYSKRTRISVREPRW